MGDVGGVLVAEFAGEVGLFVALNEECVEGEEHDAVEQQEWGLEEAGPAGDGDKDGDVDGVAGVAVDAVGYQALGSVDGGGGAAAGDREVPDAAQVEKRSEGEEARRRARALAPPATGRSHLISRGTSTAIVPGTTSVKSETLRKSFMRQAKRAGSSSRVVTVAVGG